MYRRIPSGYSYACFVGLLVDVILATATGVHQHQKSVGECVHRRGDQIENVK